MDAITYPWWDQIHTMSVKEAPGDLQITQWLHTYGVITTYLFLLYLTITCNYVIFHRANLWWIILTHWGRVTHICVGKLTIIGSDNGSSPDRRQAIIRTNAGLLLIGPLGTNFSEILIEILTFSFKKMRFKVSSAKWRLFCLGLNELS